MKRFITSANEYSNSNVLPISDSVMYRTLAASTAEEIAIPSGAKAAVLTMIGAAGYVRGSTGSPSVAAAVPSGDVTDGSGSTPLPDGVPRMFRIDDLDHLSVISTGTPFIIAEFFS